MYSFNMDQESVDSLRVFMYNMTNEIDGKIELGNKSLLELMLGKYLSTVGGSEEERSELEAMWENHKKGLDPQGAV